MTETIESTRHDRTQPVLSRPAGKPAKTSAGQAEQLERVAREFESLLVGTLLRSLRATVPAAGLFDDAGEIKYYRQLHDDELARRMAGSGNLGIAEMITRRYGESNAALDLTPSRADQCFDWPLPRPVAFAASGPLPSMSSVEPVRVARPRALAAYRQVQTATIPRATGSLGEQAARAGQPSDFAQLHTTAESLGGAVADSLRRYAPDLERAAADTGVDPALLLSVLVHESGGNAAARSPKGAVGLMQLMPETAREVGVTDPLRPADNIMGGARYLERMLDRFRQDPELALAGYNAGPGAVARAGNRLPDYRETRGYVRRVMALYEQLRGARGTDLDKESAK